MVWASWQSGCSRLSCESSRAWKSWLVVVAFWGDFLGFMLDRICKLFGVKRYVLPKGIADYTIDEADGKTEF